MEPNIKKVFGKIVQVLVALLLWSTITIFLGLYVKWALIYDHFDVYNIMFYGWLLVSLPALCYYFYRIYKY